MPNPVYGYNYTGFFHTHTQGNIMNPFEIRAEMLKMAQTYLTKQQEINLEFAQNTFEQLVKEGKKVAEDWQTYAPKMYTFEDVLKEANKLYGFVKDAK